MHERVQLHDGVESTPFAGGRAAAVARWLVLEMMLWPGLLGAGVTAIIVHQARHQPLLWPLVAVFLIATFAAARQWRVMWRTVLLPPAVAHIQENSPRPTSRGMTTPLADSTALDR